MIGASPTANVTAGVQPETTEQHGHDDHGKTLEHGKVPFVRDHRFVFALTKNSCQASITGGRNTNFAHAARAESTKRYTAEKAKARR